MPIWSKMIFIVQYATFLWVLVIQWFTRTDLGPQDEYQQWTEHVKSKPPGHNSESETYSEGRRKIWADNFYFVQRHNADPFKSFEMKLNGIADRTHLEYIDIYLKIRFGALYDNRKGSYKSKTTIETFPLPANIRSIPEDALPKSVNYAIRKPSDQVRLLPVRIFIA
ncbi:hypothetical protein Ciccas_012652 [Cichlidogyrus casuarinus]|uniref:Cathepsin propeptide inhibitor domain-containing protein n=1 Tax=Cichlidogyrus casuarinus TaxID=1844966 RepID=A0ABD2PMR1_9PLAT